MNDKPTIIKTEYGAEAKLEGEPINATMHGPTKDGYYCLYNKYTNDYCFYTPESAAGVARGWVETGFHGAKVIEWRVVRYDWVIQETIEQQETVG